MIKLIVVIMSLFVIVGCGKKEEQVVKAPAPIVKKETAKPVQVEVKIEVKNPEVKKMEKKVEKKKTTKKEVEK